jgi:hypothetical protein
LQCVGGVRREPLTPERVDEAVTADHSPGLQGQQRKECAFADAAQVSWLAIDDDLERTEQSDLEVIRHQGSSAEVGIRFEV